MFNAGINLTHLYSGQISLVDFFIVRDMGYLHKMYRGLSGQEFWPNEIEDTIEKPWIAAVEAFAIGGGCQLCWRWTTCWPSAVSYFNLPARKEGIIPGVSNMRLWRFVGDRAARQAILFEREFQADSPRGSSSATTWCPTARWTRRWSGTVAALTPSGVVSAAGNRKAMRIGQEPDRSVSAVHGGVLSRAGVLSLQSAADSEPGAELERAHERAWKSSARVRRRDFRRGASTAGASSSGAPGSGC